MSDPGLPIKPKNLIPIKKCGKNEEYKCGPSVQASCKDPKPVCHDKHCVKGCFCKDGYLRNKNGECVRKCECDCY
ncbi:Mucin-19 [Harpegnathos saltator]|uniref:Mucin-19 n=2 Tax=Harpegnathos saltator TaxID=610380 RepID=E2BE66_HARSA|nr:Mucin-19 [Harpegnathos saltator]